MTGLLEPTVRELSFGWAHDRSVRSFSRLRKSPAGLAFKATEKLGPDISDLLSMHCSWCVLDCGEAQVYFAGLPFLLSSSHAQHSIEEGDADSSRSSVGMVIKCPHAR